MQTVAREKGTSDPTMAPDLDKPLSRTLFIGNS